MRLSKTKIREILFEHLEEFLKVKIINVNVGNGYFLFNLGQNSVVHFEIKEIPDWKFGLWITNTEDKKSFVVEMFGEREDYIDKFKPTATKISEETTIPKNQEWMLRYDSAVREFQKVLMQLKTSRKCTEYNLYFNEYWAQSFIKWLIKDIGYIFNHRWRKFYSKHFYKYRVKLIANAIRLIYHKYVETVTINENERWMPTYDIMIQLKEDVTDSVVHKMALEFFYKGFWESWASFLDVDNEINYFLK